MVNVRLFITISSPLQKYINYYANIFEISRVTPLATWRRWRQQICGFFTFNRYFSDLIANKYPFRTANVTKTICSAERLLFDFQKQRNLRGLELPCNQLSTMETGRFWDQLMLSNPSSHSCRENINFFNLHVNCKHCVFCYAFANAINVRLVIALLVTPF